MNKFKQVDNILQATSYKKFLAALPMNFDHNLYCEVGLQIIYTFIFLVLRKKPRLLLAVKRN